VYKDLIERRLHTSRKRIVRLMQEAGLKARVRERFTCTTMSDHDQHVAANVLNQECTAGTSNQRWVGDTTEFVIGESGNWKPKGSPA
jgi:transposase InsO family protein